MANKKLIYSFDFRKLLNEKIKQYPQGSTQRNMIYAVLQWLDKVPRIDAEPVRHGRWIEYTYWIGSFGQIHTKCSVCGTDYPCRKGGRGDGKGGKYCEECGAKMDGDVNATD